MSNCFENVPRLVQHVLNMINSPSARGSAEPPSPRLCVFRNNKVVLKQNRNIFHQHWTELVFTSPSLPLLSPVTTVSWEQGVALFCTSPGQTLHLQNRKHCWSVSHLVTSDGNGTGAPSADMRSVYIHFNLLVVFDL